ncbi:hypothetical protein DFJ74DRAFT_439157 [Hyaloraphidium curvatum]|nr:hypothetical protein DFJ74DRAFT_439157 [Hyaloraphidium curvatum]
MSRAALVLLAALVVAACARPAAAQNLLYFSFATFPNANCSGQAQVITVVPVQGVPSCTDPIVIAQTGKCNVDGAASNITTCSTTFAPVYPPGTVGDFAEGRIFLNTNCNTTDLSQTLGVTAVRAGSCTSLSAIGIPGSGKATCNANGTGVIDAFTDTACASPIPGIQIVLNGNCSVIPIGTFSAEGKCAKVDVPATSATATATVAPTTRTSFVTVTTSAPATSSAAPTTAAPTTTSRPASAGRVSAGVIGAVAAVGAVFVAL